MSNFASLATKLGVFAAPLAANLTQNSTLENLQNITASTLINVLNFTLESNQTASTNSTTNDTSTLNRALLASLLSGIAMCCCFMALYNVARAPSTRW